MRRAHRRERGLSLFYCPAGAAGLADEGIGFRAVAEGHGLASRSRFFSFSTRCATLPGRIGLGSLRRRSRALLARNRKSPWRFPRHRSRVRPRKAESNLPESRNSQPTETEFPGCGAVRHPIIPDRRQHPADRIPLDRPPRPGILRNLLQKVRHQFIQRHRHPVPVAPPPQLQCHRHPRRPRREQFFPGPCQDTTPTIIITR